MISHGNSCFLDFYQIWIKVFENPAENSNGQGHNEVVVPIEGAIMQKLQQVLIRWLFNGVTLTAVWLWVHGPLIG
jgi:hypothetical protein